eukprot:1137391-Pelagomonas_calceolata.AAC.3
MGRSSSNEDATGRLHAPVVCLLLVFAERERLRAQGEAKAEEAAKIGAAGAEPMQVSMAVVQALGGCMDVQAHQAYEQALAVAMQLCKRWVGARMCKRIKHMRKHWRLQCSCASA